MKSNHLPGLGRAQSRAPLAVRERPGRRLAPGRLRRGVGPRRARRCSTARSRGVELFVRVRLSLHVTPPAVSLPFLLSLLKTSALPLSYKNAKAQSH